MEPLYAGHTSDLTKCSDEWDVLISVVGCTIIYKYTLEYFRVPINTGVSSFQGVRLEGVHSIHIRSRLKTIN